MIGCCVKAHPVRLDVSQPCAQVGRVLQVGRKFHLGTTASHQHVVGGAAERTRMKVPTGDVGAIDSARRPWKLCDLDAIRT